MNEIKINEKERKCLEIFVAYYNAEESCIYFRTIVEKSKLTLKEVRRATVSSQR